MKHFQIFQKQELWMCLQKSCMSQNCPFISGSLSVMTFQYQTSPKQSIQSQRMLYFLKNIFIWFFCFCSSSASLPMQNCSIYDSWIRFEPKKPLIKMCEAELKSKLCIQLFKPIYIMPQSSKITWTNKSFCVVHAIQNIYVHPFQNKAFCTILLEKLLTMNCSRVIALAVTSLMCNCCY